MEVVLLGTALSHAVVLLIDWYGKRPPAQTSAPKAPQQIDATEPSQAAESENASARENADSSDQPGSETEQPLPEGSIPALRQKLKHLRAEAKRFNAPDTFVQYARLTREANEVEKELMEKKALEPNSGDSTGLPDMTRLISRLLTPHAKETAKRSAQVMAMKMVVRVVLFVSMWVYFSQYGAGAGSGEVMVMDCRAFRPFSFLFRKREAVCLEEDWTCAAQAPQCVVSYTMVLILGNAVFSMAGQALR